MTYTYRDDQEDLNDIFFIFISCCDDEIFWFENFDFFSV